MPPHFVVRYTSTAREDLLRLFDFLLERATTLEDFDAAQQLIDTLRSDVEGKLSRSPFIFRKSENSSFGNPFWRELLIPVGQTGYVVLYEIENDQHVNVLAVRHQLEDDYH
jgi:plasmid stabilization system protein ParE